MNRHTPGNWIAVGSMVELDDDNRPDICCVAPAMFGQQDTRTVTEMRANALLIAAAPDLLAALEMCAKQLDEITGMVHEERAALISAKAAIAKAKGAV